MSKEAKRNVQIIPAPPGLIAKMELFGVPHASPVLGVVSWFDQDPEDGGQRFDVITVAPDPADGRIGPASEILPDYDEFYQIVKG